MIGSWRELKRSIIVQQLTGSLSWSLPTGFNSPITYWYLGFFIVLLLHRQIRDDEACQRKYGKDWDKYCELVPYRIIPYVVSDPDTSESARADSLVLDGLDEQAGKRHGKAAAHRKEHEGRAPEWGVLSCDYQRRERLNKAEERSDINSLVPKP